MPKDTKKNPAPKKKASTKKEIAFNLKKSKLTNGKKKKFKRG